MSIFHVVLSTMYCFDTVQERKKLLNARFRNKSDHAATFQGLQQFFPQKNTCVFWNEPQYDKLFFASPAVFFGKQATEIWRLSTQIQK